MDGVGTSIVGRPRRLSADRRARPTYTFIWEEPLLVGKNKPTTFLRRAERPEMRDVPVADVAESFQQTVTEAGRSIQEDLARECAKATEGYPFMIQLVGYHVWRKGRTGAVAADDGPSRVSDIAARMTRDRNYVSVYRDRLIRAGMIYPAGFGMVDLEMPFMREYLREHATHLLAGRI